MALTLKDLRSSRSSTPARILIYGPPGLGKTSLAASFPKPVLLKVEDGVPAGVDIASFDITSFDGVMEAISALYSEEHDFKTVILDTLDRLEPLLWAKLCADQKWANIESPGYGKGYALADSYWREALDGLNALRRDRGMTVVLIAHSSIERFDDPQASSYSRYDIRLHKRASAIVQDEVDAILFVNQDVTIKTEEQGFNKTRARADGGQTRWIYTEGRPSFTAKNRFGMPERVLYERGRGFDLIAPYLPGGTGAQTKKEAA